jgi:cell division protein FtsL
MMRESRGNTAFAVPFEKTVVKPEKQERPKRVGLPAGEKLLYLGSVVLCVTLSAFVLSQHATSAQLNMQTQQLEQQAAELKESNQQLQAELAQLKSSKRIREFARDNGMKLVDRMQTLPPMQKQTDKNSKVAVRDNQG